MYPLIFALLVAVPFAELDEAALDQFIRTTVAGESRFESRVEDFAREALGTDYHDGPLGEGPDGTHDQDPLVDWTRVDCVTYVEQTVAFAAGRSYTDAFAGLQRIRYRGGAIGYETRNHFMLADWVQANPWCEDVSQALGVETTALTRTISKRDFFQKVKAPELGQDTPDREVTIHYVPVGSTAEAEQQLPSPAMIVFIGKIDWLFALHCGLYIRDADGVGKLYHASSKADAVVTVDLPAYAGEQASRYLGFTAYRITEPKYND